MSNTTSIEKRSDLLGANVVKALQRRHFEAYYCKTGSEAAAKALSLIPAEHTVSWGGSMTLKDIGLSQKIKDAGFAVLDRDTAKTPEEKADITRRALLCDTYLAGINAVSEDGQLVNIDGNGNRIAAISFGPKSVILVAGMNKVVKTLDDALSRARNLAAPLNVQRFPDLQTPCAATGSCADCLSAQSICSYIVTTRLCKPAGRIKVILAGEPLGY
ncbi:MAG: lactate utilization protein [Planctomycetaceae bacterium]|jgi:L-lactate utilization protein LutB|nr:lactate utilization protein [Planctomycetaceae bacterium]